MTGRLEKPYDKYYNFRFLKHTRKHLMLNFGVFRFILKLYTEIGPNFFKSDKIQYYCVVDDALKRVHKPVFCILGESLMLYRDQFITNHRLTRRLKSLSLIPRVFKPLHEQNG